MISHHTRRNPVKLRDEKEKNVDEIFKDLKDKHKDKYTGAQLLLWARMITNGLHQSLDDPP